MGSVAGADGTFTGEASAARDAVSNGVSARGDGGAVELTPATGAADAVSLVIFRFLSASNGENAGFGGSAERVGGAAAGGRLPALCDRAVAGAGVLPGDATGNLLRSSSTGSRRPR